MSTSEQLSLTPPPKKIGIQDTPGGYAFAVAAYVFWGFMPFYMKAVAHIPAAEVVAHRVIWSIPIAGLVLIVLRRTSDLRAALSSPRTLVMAMLTASLVSINWGIYVWAIAADQAVETALGYYINPLFSIFLGAVLLGEKLDGLQKTAVGIAVIAISVLAYDAGGLPWVSVGLALSWGFYGFFRKTLPVGPNQGFLLEVLMLSIPSLGYIGWLMSTGQSHFGTTSTADLLLLLGCGVITAVPLMLFANGAKLLKLSTIGILQYIAPTMIFLIAVFIFKEPFGFGKLIAFVLTWTALAIYSMSLIRQHRASRKQVDGSRHESLVG